MILSHLFSVAAFLLLARALVRAARTEHKQPIRKHKHTAVKVQMTTTRQTGHLPRWLGPVDRSAIMDTACMHQRPWCVVRLQGLGQNQHGTTKDCIINMQILNVHFYHARTIDGLDDGIDLLTLLHAPQSFGTYFTSTCCWPAHLQQTC